MTGRLGKNHRDIHTRVRRWSGPIVDPDRYLIRGRVGPIRDRPAQNEDTRAQRGDLLARISGVREGGAPRYQGPSPDLPGRDRIAP